MEPTTPAPHPSLTGDATTPAADWSRHDHPVVTALAGFLAGLVFVTVVPGGWIGVLRLFLDYDRAEQLFPLVLVALVVPIGLVAAGRTRRFGLYMLLGMVTTAVVVLGVASLVLWLMVLVER